jgi:hypothetical protein
LRGEVSKFRKYLPQKGQQKRGWRRPDHQGRLPNIHQSIGVDKSTSQNVASVESSTQQKTEMGKSTQQQETGLVEKSTQTDTELEADMGAGHPGTSSQDTIRLDMEGYGGVWWGNPTDICVGQQDTCIYLPTRNPWKRAAASTAWLRWPESWSHPRRSSE